MKADTLKRLAAFAPPGMEVNRSFLDQLSSAYAGPPRVYHTLDHVVAMARKFAVVGRHAGWAEPCPTYLAVLTHDAVYEAGRNDNESRSAALTRSWADAHWPGTDWGVRAAVLVQASAAHHALPVGDDADLDLFLDCDLTVLGARTATYDAYAAGIRAEYAPVVGNAYDAGRAAFLRSLLDRDAIFRSVFFRKRLEARARQNLRREIAMLE